MKLTRRDFLKLTGAGATAAMLYKSGVIEKALDIIAKKVSAYNPDGTNVAWLQGQCCTGCTISLLNWCGEYNNTYYTNIVSLLQALNIGSDGTDAQQSVLPLDFHPTIDTRAGVYYSSDGVSYTEYNDEAPGTPTDYPYWSSMKHLLQMLEDVDSGTGEVIVVIEGAIPPAKVGDLESTFCEVGMKDSTHMYQFEDLVVDVVDHDCVNLVIAYGTCASFGGIPHGTPNPTGTRSVMERLSEHGINKTVVNIPGCPAHPDWFVLVLAAYIANGTNYIKLDTWKRPIEVTLDGTNWIPLFKYPNHYNCERYNSFNNGDIADDFQKAYNSNKCLVKLGCRGMIAYACCPGIDYDYDGDVSDDPKWNHDFKNPIYMDKNLLGNWCVRAGSPCNACVDPQYPDFSFWREPEHYEMYESGLISSLMNCYYCHKDAKR